MTASWMMSSRRQVVHLGLCLCNQFNPAAFFILKCLYQVRNRSGHAYICERGIDLVSVSMIFRLNFGTAPTVWYFLLFFFLLNTVSLQIVVTYSICLIGSAEVYSKKYYVIKFVNDLRQGGSFLWFSPTNKIDRHDITEKRLKVELNTIKQTEQTKTQKTSKQKKRSFIL